VGALEGARVALPSPRKRGLGTLASAGAGSAAGARRPTLAEVADELRAALAAQDFERVGEAEARLRAFVAGDEGRALELLELFKRETDPAFLAVVAGVLGADPAAQGSQALAAALASIAEDPSAPAARREQALAVLSQSTAALPDLERRLAALAATGDADFRQAALAALASRAHGLPPERGRAEATEALLRAVRAEPEPDLRAAFLAGIPLRDAPEAALRDVSAALASDPSPAVREAAAHALGDVSAGARGGTAAALEEAFRREGDLGARRAILISLVRLLGPGAAGPIGRLRPVAGATQVDCDDYLAILASGETQADRIFEAKVAREAARGQVPGADGHDHHD
jgi:hypothetical protein